jgi:dihydrofolate synthase/folylpolyglutamate synthase
MKAEELGLAAREVFGEDRVTVAPFLPDAIDQAVAIAESGASGSSLGSGAVLITGSVVTVGEARHLLKGLRG